MNIIQFNCGKNNNLTNRLQKNNNDLNLFSTFRDKIFLYKLLKIYCFLYSITRITIAKRIAITFMIVPIVKIS